MDKHRCDELDALIGQQVRAVLYDGSRAAGVPGYADEFSGKHGWRSPGRYYIGSLSLRKSHIKKIERA